jgi:ubiquinone/menaquinone biosynthesis C-methylase UbiE
MTSEQCHTAPPIPCLAGWYQRVFAWLLSRGIAKYDQAVADRKRAIFADLHGDVLEIGPGTGINLSYYPVGIRWIGIEPNRFMHPYLKKEAERLHFDIDLRSGKAEQLEIQDNSLDVVVGTLVLCSVENPNRVLQEIVRVLKPGGRFLFLEHVAAPLGTWLRRVQHWLRPVWKVALDGCCPDRDTLSVIESAGFDCISCQHFRAPLPIVGPHVAGLAIKRAHFNT